MPTDKHCWVYALSPCIESFRFWAEAGGGVVGRGVTDSNNSKNKSNTVITVIIVILLVIIIQILVLRPSLSISSLKLWFEGRCWTRPRETPSTDGTSVAL